MISIDLSKLREIDEADVTGKRVLVRADLNVPLHNGEVSDATRIERVLPGIDALAGRGAKVVILSHFGRPEGQARPEMSLRPIAEALAELGGRPVAFAPDCVGEPAEAVVSGLANGAVALFENVRFHPGEEGNDPAFASALAQNGDLYVNDAFSCAHRAHASTEGLAHVLPAFAGPQMMSEIKALRDALENPERPVAAVVGGAKVSTKIPVLANLSRKVDALIIGGGMANTFLHANGLDVGRSLCEPDFADTAREIMHEAEAAGCAILLPSDVVAADAFSEGAAHATYDVKAVPADRMILDVGPASVSTLIAYLANCRTLLWNGPLGAFEIAPFGEGTFALARRAAALTEQGKLKTIAGGGDTVAALNAAGVTNSFTYVSTAGGAFLEWLEGRDLPGVVALACN